MRLDSVLDSFYVLSSLWGGPQPQVCSTRPDITRGAVREVVSAPAEVTAFVGVHVVPMDTERVLANQTVLVEDGRIIALGPADEVKVPAGAVRIDGRGKYLMPGLADMHVHNLSIGNIRGQTRDEIAALAFAFLADGVTGVRHLHEGSLITQEQVQLARSGEVLSPRLYLSGVRIGRPTTFGRAGPRVTGQAWDLSGNQIERLDSVAPVLAAAQAAGYNIISVAAKEVHARQTSPLVDSMLAIARRRGMVVAAHDHDWSLEKNLPLGVYDGSFEHVYALTSALHFDYWRSSLTDADADAVIAEIPAVAASVQRAGVWVTPTLNCSEKHAVPPTHIRVIREIVKGLQNAGVGLLLSGDDGRNVHGELAAFVRAGLTPYQALLTGTRNVAQYMGLLDSVGTVAVGKWADVVLLRGNPLADIQYTREPAGVMIRGRWLDRAALDRGLLAAPPSRKVKSWIRRRVLHNGIDPHPTQEQHEQLEVHVVNFEALIDSLAVATASEQTDTSAAQRVRQRMVDEFVAMRAILRPEQHPTLDLIVRMWLREQARQGHPMSVPGVAPGS